MLFFIFPILLGLGTFIFIQYQKQRKASKLYLEAKALERKVSKIPCDLTRLKQALALYKQCQKFVEKPEYVKALIQCQQAIDNRYKFKDLLANGRKKASRSCFKEALIEFINAQKLFNTSELEYEISKCQDNIKQQDNYEKDLKQSARIARQGRFKEALDLLRPMVNKFPRRDGEQLLARLERVQQAKELYSLGLFAEEKSNLEEARTKYEEVLDLLPEFAECKIRLSILTVKCRPQRAIYYLQALEGEQAAYIRGFAYAQLGNWSQADREWKSISNRNIEVQRYILKDLLKRGRLNSTKEIEKSVDRKKLEIAKTLCLEFIEKFGSDPTIKHNLENHIQPLIKRQVWKSQDWQKIAAKNEQIWLEQQDIKSLHNWALATYYQAQINPNKLTNFVVAWSTALANIDSNPIWENIPWLGSSSIDVKDISAKLKQILENAIDAIKDSNIHEYLKLRDIYRCEMLALSLVKQNNCGVRIKQRLFILPGCYQRFRDYLPRINFPAEIWGALYTDWGLAVAACLEGDTARAIKIKPEESFTSDADYYAHSFVSYREGCHYLQNLEWRKAVKSLEFAEHKIKVKFEWCREINRLCEAQRQKIRHFDEHLEFSQFWYELTESRPARNYFAECKARQVAEKLSNEIISHEQGLNELKEIQNNIDRNNSVVLELIKTVETVREAEKIDCLLQQGQFEKAVTVAKGSSNENVRFRVAEICLEIIFKQIQSGDVSYEVVRGLNQIAQWAYELCPYEPAFQPVYRQLREIGIRC